MSEKIGLVLASTELEIREDLLLDVFIWSDVISMREFTLQQGECLACYTEGEIHLVEGEFGAGIFAHELQHFIQDWICTNELNPMEDEWEDIAYLAGHLTSQFWNWFYDNFELEKENNNER